MDRDDTWDSSKAALLVCMSRLLPSSKDNSRCLQYLVVVVVVVVVAVSYIQRIGCQPEKNYFTRWPIPLVICWTGKKIKIKSLAAHPPPPRARAARSEKKKRKKKEKKITPRINMSRRYASRRYAGGLGPSRIRTRIPTTCQLGQWVSLRKTLRFRVRVQLSQSRCLSLLLAMSGRVFLFLPPRGHEPPPTLRDLVWYEKSRERQNKTKTRTTQSIQYTAWALGKNERIITRPAGVVLLVLVRRRRPLPMLADRSLPADGDLLCCCGCIRVPPEVCSNGVISPPICIFCYCITVPCCQSIVSSLTVPTSTLVRWRSRPRPWFGNYNLPPHPYPRCRLQTYFPLPPRLVVAPVGWSPRPDIPSSYHRAALFLRFWVPGLLEEDIKSWGSF